MSALRVSVGPQEKASILHRFNQGGLLPHERTDGNRPLTITTIAAPPVPVVGNQGSITELTFNQGPTLEPDSYRPGIQASGGRFAVLSTLLPESAKLVAEARNETRLVGA